MLRLIGCVTQQHDIGLVGLAALVCILACGVTLNLFARALAAAGRERAVWLACVALAFGGGVWATHFVAMLAYRPGITFGFAAPLTLLSLLLPVAGAGLAFGTLAQAPRDAGARVIAGVLLGVSVSAMHLTGMAAMRVAARLQYDLPTLAAAVLVGVVFACLAVRTNGAGREVRALALLALAVCGMHFTAMSAVTLTPGGPPPPAAGLLTPGPLALAIAAIATLILGFSQTAAIMDRRRAGALAAEALRLHGLLNSLFEGILFHRDGIVTEVNARLCALLGLEAAALVGRDVASVLGADALVPAGIAGPARAAETEVAGADGRRLPVELLARPLSGGGRGECVVAVSDLSERKRAEQRIRHLVQHDPLTGIANRALLGEMAAQALSLADRSRHSVALFCFDLDGFKQVNDLHGHAVGDALLAAVAGRIAGGIRQMDTVARLGNDEFAILQPLANQPEAAAGLAERIVRLIGQPFEIGDKTVCTGASVGIARYPTDAASFEALLRNADLARRRAKQEGKNTFRFFESGVDERIRDLRQLEGDLRDALANNQMELHYQGQFDAARLELVGYEALLRWTHPTRGRISPAEFVPIAEGAGLIGQLGQWVLETACREAAGWPLPLRVSVNLSPLQFRRSDLPRRVLETLRRAGLAPERLELEVTEGVLIDDADRVLEILNAVKRYGVRLALDDFGTGYSSLSYLHRFPFDTLKLDKSFVQAIGQDAEADAIVRAVVGLGRSLDRTVVAEGVETPQQLAFLRAQNCHLIQGFLLARPQPAAALDHGIPERARA